MSTQNLTSAGNANSARRNAQADELVAEDSSGVLAAFKTHVAGSAMSSNANADKIKAFDEAATVLHSRAYRIHCADGNTAAGLLEFMHGPWPQRRQAFEDLWEGGRAALYGALNSGNMGTEEPYGQFCLVVEDPESSASGVAVFPRDSAQSYTDESAAVDEAAARADATAWGDRQALCVLQCKDAALASQKDSWPAVVCTREHYLEVVRVGELPLSEVTAVRIRRSVKEAADDFLARQALLPPADRQSEREKNSVLAAEADAVQTINRWRRTLSIDRQIIDEEA